MSTHLETDYLIVGSGAVGMAFADTLLTETGANFIIVDRYAKAGGHWNVAYPFVTLHQPSAYYGVSSREMSKNRKDKTGLNKGLNDLATGAEVSAYYDDIMRHTFLASGRVQYFPMCNYTGDGNFTKKLTGDEYHVKYNKIVDATYLNTYVPATHTPNFAIADEAQFMPLNDLVKLKTPPEGFVVIGGGKTGIDACLWLLEMGIHPDTITWIISRDAWLLNRQNTQPGVEFFEHSIGAQAAQFESIANAESVDDMFDRLESAGYFLRLDPEVRPQMFHGATVTKLEREELRKIKNTIRLGRVTAVEADQIVLEKGTIPTSTRHVHVDCSASAIINVDTVPVFQGNLITPQAVLSYQPIFSASFIAHIEAAYRTEREKNKLCSVVPLPNYASDFVQMTAANMTNQYVWSQNPEIKKWLMTNRLDAFTKMVDEVDKADQTKAAILNRLRSNAMPAMIRLQVLLEELKAKS